MQNSNNLSHSVYHSHIQQPQTVQSNPTYVYKAQPYSIKNQQIRYIPNFPLSYNTQPKTSQLKMYEQDQKIAQLKDLDQLSLKNNEGSDTSSIRLSQSRMSSYYEPLVSAKYPLQKSRISFIHSSKLPSFQNRIIQLHPKVQQMPLNYALNPQVLAHPPKPIQIIKNIEENQQKKQMVSNNFVKAKQIGESKIQIEIKAYRHLIKLKTTKVVPAMVTIKSGKGIKTNADIVCVIDNSGSMNGDKISLVKDTISYLIDVLSQNDRLSIITFNSDAKLVCNLDFMNAGNKIKVLNLVKSINADGSTNISSGLELALKTLRERQFVNQATSIFLLSDGQNDPGYQSPKIVFKRNLELEQNKKIGAFTLNSFGYGNNHDQDLMSGLSSLTDGIFYYIMQSNTVDQAFCDALGAVFSTVATSIKIRLQKIAQGIVKDINITKTFGKLKKTKNNQVYQVNLNNLPSEVTRDYVFELTVPSIMQQIGDINRNQNILKASFTAKSLSNQTIKGECILNFTLLNANQQMPKSIESTDVMQNYLRVITADQIKKALKNADNRKFADAKAELQRLINFIKPQKNIRQIKKQELLKDIQQISKKLQSEQKWYIQGRKLTTTIMSSHINQNSYSYSNNTQISMSNQLQQRKMCSMP